MLCPPESLDLEEPGPLENKQVQEQFSSVSRVNSFITVNRWVSVQRGNKRHLKATVRHTAS